MKKIYLFLLISLSVAAVCACNKEIDTEDNEIQEAAENAISEQNVPEGYVWQTFSATIDETKTDINDSGGTVWSRGDKIKIVYGVGNSYVASEFELDADENYTPSNSGSFKGAGPEVGTPLYAVYPSNAYDSVSGSTVNVTVPASQNGTFAAGNIAVAKIAANHSMSFKNINSFLVFQLKTGSEVTKVEVTSVDGHALVGTVPVDCSGDNPSAGTATSPSSTVSMTTNGAGTYYMSIVSGATHAKGLKMTYYTGSGTYTETGVYYLNRNLTIAANQMYTLGEVETDKNYYVTVSGVQNGNGMSWDSPISAAKMWKMLHLAGTDAATDAAKLAAINGATFHMAAGTYDFGDDPTISFNETDPVTITIKGGYNASTGVQSWTTNQTNITGARIGSAGSYSGHPCLKIRGKINVSLEGLRFINGYVSGDKKGALDAADSGVSLSMTDCYVGNNINDGSSAAGAGIELYGLASFEATNVTIDNNTGHHAPGLYAYSTGLTLTDCTISNNHATSWGGAVRTEEAGSTTSSFTGCSFTNNSASGDSGCMVLYGGTVNVTDCTFSGNSSTGNGGAISLNGSSSTTLNISGGTFSGNQAGEGGAIYHANNASTITVSKYNSSPTTFLNNVATGKDRDGGMQANGGAVWIRGTGTVTFNDAVFKGNHTMTGASSNGGAIHMIWDTPTLELNRCIFGGTGSGEANYSAKDGGALSLRAGSTTITDCSFIGNHAYYDTSDRGENDVAFDNVKDIGYGGAIDCYSDANMTINGGTFSGNVAWRGGAINCSATGTILFEGVTFTANGTAEATRAGGAIYGQRIWTVTNCTFGGANAADGNKAKFGGAINHVKHKSGNNKLHGLMTLNGGIFKNNVAAENGGAICEESAAIINPYNNQGTLFQDNSVTTDIANTCGGGALWAETYSSSNNQKVVVNGAVFKGNEAFSGGACFVFGSKSGLDMNNCTFGGANSGDANYARGDYDSDNQIYGGGGTLCIYPNTTDDGKITTATLTDCTITGDYALRCGGSVYNYSANSSFTAKRCTFTGCNADNGGAIYGSAGTVNVDYSTFQGNHTSAIADEDGKRGGAIFITGTATIKVFQSAFNGNYGSRGGAIQAQEDGSGNKPTVFVDASSFSGNYVQYKYGTAINIDNASYFCINNSSFNNNTYCVGNYDSTKYRESCWIAIDGIVNKAIVSNCSLMGRTKYNISTLAEKGALVAVYSGADNKVVFVNNLFINNAGSMKSIGGARDSGNYTVTAYYTHYSNIQYLVFAEGSTGNFSGKWKERTLNMAHDDEPDWQEDNYWDWSGDYYNNDKSAYDHNYSMITLEAFTGYLNAACPAFVDWLSSDINNDQIGNSRGTTNWRPGAYQGN